VQKNLETSRNTGNVPAGGLKNQFRGVGVERLVNDLAHTLTNDQEANERQRRRWRRRRRRTDG
jgi:hypothetical protein